ASQLQVRSPVAGINGQRLAKVLDRLGVLPLSLDKNAGVEMSQHVVRVDAQRVPKMVQAFVEAAERNQGERQVLMAAFVVGLDRQALLKTGDCLLRLARFGEGDSEAVESHRIGRGYFQGMPPERNAVVPVSHLPPARKHADDEQQPGETRRQPSG